MENDAVTWAVVGGSAIFIGFLYITVFHATSRKARTIGRRIKCWFGTHKPTGVFEPAIGGRNVMRCLYCDKVTREIKVTKDNIRRTT
jgi:hypothetical protein